ncbi:MAG: EthD domain-containing protein [Deltaproteobacteria bacterium]|nr:EthD domain-containing protein [Deltaproteobacteria bacterium]
MRRPDLERAAFAQHYDPRHAALALRLLPVSLAAYRRNHVVWPDDSAFDCLSEFCFADAGAAKRIFEFRRSSSGSPTPMRGGTL